MFLNFTDVAYNQIITGSIVDNVTKKPIEFAYIYFNASSVGTQSDQSGHFSLDVSKNAPNPLIISAIGYYSLTLLDYLKNPILNIGLTPKPIELNEINISAKSLSKKRVSNLKTFKNVFLGTGENAQHCEIINEADIKFDYESGDTLKATSTKPLIINNKALGYQLIYYLENFEYDRSNRSFSFQGNLSFKENGFENEVQKAIIDDKRRNAYLGSRMHFLRSLWSNDLESNGFTVKNKFGRNLRPDEIVYRDGFDKKYLRYNETLGICYLSDFPFSHLEILKDRIYFYRNGYSDPFGLIWEGYIAEKKVADMLPLEYEPSMDNSVAYKKAQNKDLNSNRNSPEIETEKIYLHVDKDIYNPGDNLWFKAYIIDGLSHKLTANSGNLHVELISPESKIISNRIVKIENGLGNGDFILPDSLVSGNYLLRAYTNYIRNFGNQLFFNKQISIINSSSFPINFQVENTEEYDKEFDLTFFPESGSLIYNVESTVAFKAIDASGGGCHVTGDIYSSHNEKIASFETTHLGMGAFKLTPMPSTFYYAIIRNETGHVIKRDLPKPFSNGFVLNLIMTEGNQNVLSIITNKETFSDNSSKDLILCFSSHKRILYSKNLRITSLHNPVELPLDSLPEGIVMITLFDRANKPLCERLIYVEHINSPVLNISTDKNLYIQRDSVKIKISLDADTDDEAHLSVSVCDSINVIGYSKYPRTIASWFLLESDIHGPIEDPSYYFNHSNPNRMKNLNLLLLTQGWRDFEWKYDVNKYSSENGFSISGKLLKSLSNNPLENGSIDIGVFQDNKNVFTSVITDSMGRFQFDIENLSGQARLIVSANTNKGKATGRVILDTLVYIPPEVKFKPVGKQKAPDENVPGNYYLLYKADSLRKDITHKYSLADTILIGEVTITGRKKQTPQEVFVDQNRTIYGQPDSEIIIGPNEGARTVRDLLMGKVAGLTFVKQINRGQSGIRIRGVGSSLVLNNYEPLFLLDGLEASYDQICGIPMDFIDRVDVIKSEKTAAFGMRGANGVISVITKTWKDVPFKPSLNSVSTTISGFNVPRIFYSPKYETKSPNTLPDLRSTLYWNPSLNINPNKDYILKYFNAENSSEYIIVVEGITSKGIPLSNKIKYVVK